jgi:ketosteroid isomerase-like protein
MATPLAVAERLVRATNDHDLEALLACFEPDYRSEQPAHPARAFEGVAQVQKNWSTLLEAVPDIRWEIISSAETGDTAWLELDLTGTHADGTKLHELGVVILGVPRERIAWAHLYLEDVEADGGDIDETVRQMAGTEGDDSPASSSA